MKIVQLLKSFAEKVFSSGPVSSRQKGDEGERMACSLLRKKGYSILERSWRWHRYELDIIARKDNLVVFVEVKTRKNTAFGLPEMAVNYKKKSFIVRASRAYIKKKRLERSLIRFDIVSVIIAEDGKKEIRHIENAFEVRY